MKIIIFIVLVATIVNQSIGCMYSYQCSNNLQCLKSICQCEYPDFQIVVNNMCVSKIDVPYTNCVHGVNRYLCNCINHYGWNEGTCSIERIYWDSKLVGYKPVCRSGKLDISCDCSTTPYTGRHCEVKPSYDCAHTGRCPGNLRCQNGLCQCQSPEYQVIVNNMCLLKIDVPYTHCENGAERLLCNCVDDSTNSEQRCKIQSIYWGGRLYGYEPACDRGRLDIKCDCSDTEYRGKYCQEKPSYTCTSNNNCPGNLECEYGLCQCHSSSFEVTVNNMCVSKIDVPYIHCQNGPGRLLCQCVNGYGYANSSCDIQPVYWGSTLYGYKPVCKNGNIDVSCDCADTQYTGKYCEVKPTFECSQSSQCPGNLQCLYGVCQCGSPQFQVIVNNMCVSKTDVPYVHCYNGVNRLKCICDDFGTHLQESCEIRPVYWGAKIFGYKPVCNGTMNITCDCSGTPYTGTECEEGTTAGVTSPYNTTVSRSSYPSESSYSTDATILSSIITSSNSSSITTDVPYDTGTKNSTPGFWNWTAESGTPHYTVDYSGTPGPFDLSHVQCSWIHGICQCYYPDQVILFGDLCAFERDLPYVPSCPYEYGERRYSCLCSEYYYPYSEQSCSAVVQIGGPEGYRLLPKCPKRYQVVIRCAEELGNNTRSTALTTDQTTAAGSSSFIHHSSTT